FHRQFLGGGLMKFGFKNSSTSAAAWVATSTLRSSGTEGLGKLFGLNTHIRCRFAMGGSVGRCGDHCGHSTGSAVRGLGRATRILTATGVAGPMALCAPPTFGG